MFLPPTEVHAQIPEQISLDRFQTLNGYGFVFLKPSPLLTDFIEEEAHVGASLMEIGAGFGNAPIESLKRNVGMYVANDISQEHLDVLRTRAELALDSTEKLVFLTGKAPGALPKVNEMYDAILIDKTLHFFTPEEVEAFLAWAYAALKQQGHLYILTISPYIPSYREKVLPYYLENKGARYPGYLVDADDFLNTDAKNDSTYRVPKSMLFFTLEDLQSLMGQGWKVEKTYSLALPTEATPFWQNVPSNESALVGVKVKRDP